MSEKQEFFNDIRAFRDMIQGLIICAPNCCGDCDRKRNIVMVLQEYLDYWEKVDILADSAAERQLVR